MSLNEPALFGKYTLLRRIGKGGMAELFLATLAGPPDSERLLVVKRMLPQFAKDQEFLSMFLNEARIAGQLNHPNIVQVFDLGQEGPYLYLAMEYIDGVDIEEACKALKGRLAPEYVARIALSVCEALYYANRRTDITGQPLNVIHRDVTPGNVMLSRAGEVKLIDFGIAKAEAQLDRTRPGVVKGKFRYMSPEQIGMVELDGRSDLFSLGVMLYELTTGVRPFERKQVVDIVTAIAEYDPPLPETVLPGYPAALSNVVMRALRKDRDERYSTAREMQIGLQDYLDGASPVGPPELAALVDAAFRGVEPPPLKPRAPHRTQPTRSVAPDDVKRMVAELEAEHMEGTGRHKVKTDEVPAANLSFEAHPSLADAPNPATEPSSPSAPSAAGETPALKEKSERSTDVADEFRERYKHLLEGTITSKDLEGWDRRDGKTARQRKTPPDGEPAAKLPLPERPAFDASPPVEPLPAGIPVDMTSAVGPTPVRPFPDNSTIRTHRSQVNWLPLRGRWLRRAAGVLVLGLLSAAAGWTLREMRRSPPAAAIHTEGALGAASPVPEKPAPAAPAPDKQEPPVQPEEAPAKPATGVLSMRGSAGEEAVVDGSLRCTFPCVLSMPAGNHIVATSSGSAQASVEVKEGQTTIIDLR